MQNTEEINTMARMTAEEQQFGVGRALDFLYNYVTANLDDIQGLWTSLGEVLEAEGAPPLPETMHRAIALIKEVKPVSEEEVAARAKAFMRASLPSNPTPFLVALLQGVREEGRGYLNSLEGEGLFLMLMMMKYGQMATVDISGLFMKTYNKCSEEERAQSNQDSAIAALIEEANAYEGDNIYQDLFYGHELVDTDATADGADYHVTLITGGILIRDEQTREWYSR